MNEKSVEPCVLRNTLKGRSQANITAIVEVAGGRIGPRRTPARKKSRVCGNPSQTGIAPVLRL